MQPIATALVELGLSQAGVVHRRQLRQLGISRRHISQQLEAGLLERRAPDLFVIGRSPATWEQRIWSALLVARQPAVVSHRSAAHVHGIGRFGPTWVDVVEIGDLSGRVAGGAAPHRSNLMPEHHRTEVRGLPVTTVPRTVFDLAGQVSIKRYRRGWPSLWPREVARALDDAIGRGIEVQAFRSVLSDLGGRGRGGTVLMRSLLDARGEGFVATESELEDLLVEVLDRYDLPTPVRQRRIGGLDDRIGRVDFLYRDEALVIEVDGRKNHTALLDRESDAWRDLELAAAGFKVLRVTWSQLAESPRRFVANLRQVLDRSRSR